MDPIRVPDDLVLRGAETTIVLLVLDGLGGLPDPATGRTELESARTPNLDALAARGSLGRLLPVAPGVTPGSGPAHLALFGYDPLHYVIGRGVLSALGVGFDLRPGDVAVRLNLATFDSEGRILDRRAGRVADSVARQLVARLQAELGSEDGVHPFLLHEKEHRAVLILRGEGLGGEISDTDPQSTGVHPLPCVGREEGSERTARILERLLGQVRELLLGEAQVGGVLARGAARFDGFPSLEERFGLRGAVHARYPMYRGVARLVGMEVSGVPDTDVGAVDLLEQRYGDFSFHFVHFKAPDARGEDRDFEGKVRAIEAVDALLPRVTALEPEVLIVTGDHSTPATMGVHSWHHVPLLLASPWARPSASSFSESSCRSGELGSMESRFLMNLALAHAGRLAKFGA